MYMDGPQLDIGEYTSGEQERLKPALLGKSFGNQVFSQINT